MHLFLVFEVSAMNKKSRSPDPNQDHDPDPGEDLVSKGDIESWAERERQRRRAWLEGPTDTERDEWADLERRRRRRRQRSSLIDEDDVAEGRRIADRWQRDVELILAGIAGRLVESPFSLLGYLAREGRDFEEEFEVGRRRRRRVPTDDEA
jgi:hypothetical protein